MQPDKCDKIFFAVKIQVRIEVMLEICSFYYPVTHSHFPGGTLSYNQLRNLGICHINANDVISNFLPHFLT